VTEHANARLLVEVLRPLVGDRTVEHLERVLAVAEHERREQEVVDLGTRRTDGGHADRAELDAVGELALAAQLVAAEVLDHDLAAGALADELHELALAFGVNPFCLDGAHAETQRGLLGGAGGRGAECGQQAERQQHETAAALRATKLVQHDCVLLPLSVCASSILHRPACVRCGSQSTSCGM
jgi:hypothetical protein